MDVERRGNINLLDQPNNSAEEDLGVKAKSFKVSKREVWEAWKIVRSNRGGPGIDGQSIEEFDCNVGDNLYKLWNRMSSGSYIPKGVKRVDIPKPDGTTRPLGIPSVFDRVAQTVVKRRLEPELELVFSDNSYGFRPNRSAIEALKVARERCWTNAWVVDIDIQSFFDDIDHDLLMKAVRRHVSDDWMVLYIERWLKSPVVHKDGRVEVRTRGTPQGGVVSPLLANLYLHYVFDVWLEKHHPRVQFERYADDIICHCRTKWRAEELLNALSARFKDCGLTLHPRKTKIVYCKDYKRRGHHDHTSFDFLGFTFRPRLSHSPKSGDYFTGFNPAVSNKALKRMGLVIRRWNLQLKSSNTLFEISRMFNPVIRGWINYFGWVNKGALCELFKRLDLRLVRWAMKKYKKLRGHKRRARRWLKHFKLHNSDVFAHWRFVSPSLTG